MSFTQLFTCQQDIFYLTELVELIFVIKCSKSANMVNTGSFKFATSGSPSRKLTNIIEGTSIRNKKDIFSNL